jgi:hypothetical protein
VPGIYMYIVVASRVYAFRYLIYVLYRRQHSLDPGRC